MAVPSLNLARLPPPIKVYYPTPKGAAPQAHPGGAHLVHRSWPLPPAPAPKFNPKNPGDAIMWKELNERPKAASKPPNKMSGPQSTRGTGGPFWWGAPTHTKMPPRGHLKSTLPKAIGAELGRAPVPPRSVVFWGTRNQEGRQARRDAAVAGVDEGRERKVRTSSKKELWMPSRDVASDYFHASKSTYIRGSAALVKQQLLNERAAGRSRPASAGLTRPASAASERPGDGRRSASPALKRPSSACSMRSTGRKTSQPAWWTKNSWEKSPQDGTRPKFNTFKQRILDDIMQQATFVRVDDSDAYKFGGGHEDYRWTEVEVLQPETVDKKFAAKKKKKLRVKAKPTSRPVSRPSSAVPRKSRAPPGPAAEPRARVANKPKSERIEIRTDVRGHQPRARSPPRPSDLASHPSRTRNVSPTNVAAVMDRAKSTLRHIQALKERHLTDAEIEAMLSEYPIHVGADSYSRLHYSHVSNTLLRDYSRPGTISPEVASPCSLSGIDSDHDDDETQDTFEFTEDENLGLDSGVRRYNNDSRDHDDFQMLSSGDHSQDLADLMSGGVGEPEGVTPKDASAFMPSRPPGYFAYYEQEQRHGVFSSLAHQRQDHQNEHGCQGREEGREPDAQSVVEGGSDEQTPAGEGPEPTNRTTSSNSSSESFRRIGTEEDSREPWGVARGPKESAAHSPFSVAVGSGGGVASDLAPMPGGSTKGSSSGSRGGAWPAAAAGLFESVNNSTAHLV